MKKIFAEIGFGNGSFFSTEIEVNLKFYLVLVGIMENRDTKMCPL